LAGAHGQEIVDNAAGSIVHSSEHTWVDGVSSTELPTEDYDFLNGAFGVHACVGNGYLELRSSCPRYLVLRNGNILRSASHRPWLNVHLRFSWLSPVGGV